MVKGTSKHIVVVKSPDPKVFEQAIFFVRDDFIGKRGKYDALKEAQKVADDYIRSAVSTSKFHFCCLSPAAIAAILCAAAGVLALTFYLLF